MRIEHKDLHLILGPPGTGKTTEILRLITSLVKKGTPLSDIGFVSFTRKAVAQGRARVTEEFGLKNDKELEWFRTLHSMAYYCLGLSTEDIFNIHHCMELGKKLRMFIPPPTPAPPDRGLLSEAQKQSQGMGSRLVFIDNLARCTCTSLKEVWQKTVGNFPISFQEVERFAQTYKAFKDEYLLYDFTDIITLCGEEKDQFAIPTLSTLFVDEAQDLSRVQWRMITNLARNADTVYIAGDDDQSIYSWGGADLATFLSLTETAKDVRCLNRSYRLNKGVHTKANIIVKQIKIRNPKTWYARENSADYKEACHYIKDLREAPLHEGQWMLLARNHHFLKEYKEYLMSVGLPFQSSADQGVIDVNTQIMVLYIWEQMLAHQDKFLVPYDKVALIYSLLPSGASGVARGHKGLQTLKENGTYSLTDLVRDHGLRNVCPGAQMFVKKIPREVHSYYEKIKHHGEDLYNPRITVGTIHSVKGGECENVLLMTDMTKQTWDSFEKDPDSEHRVFYVGVTRTKRRLYILSPRTDMFYKL